MLDMYIEFDNGYVVEEIDRRHADKWVVFDNLGTFANMFELLCDAMHYAEQQKIVTAGDLM